jgi:tetratricopeptide (TPR) repeat protein
MASPLQESLEGSLMRVGLLVLLLCLGLTAEVLILKDGTRYSGKLVDKGDAWEVSTKHGSLIIKKSEVEQILTDPREASEGVDALRAEAQRLYEEGCKTDEATERNAKMDAAIKLLEKAKGIYTELRLDFATNQYAWLDDEILAIGQGIKLARDKHVLGDPKASAAEREYKTRRDALKPENADGHYALGEWCEKNGMAGNARAEFEAALKANSDHAKAREKLGYVFHEGKWLTKEERDRLVAQKPPDPPVHTDPVKPPDPVETK